MALEYSMYPQLVSGLSIDLEQMESTGSYYDGQYSADSIQKIADAFGDGFYEEDVTLESDLALTVISGSSTSSVTILAGKEIHVLRNTRYNNLAFLFMSGRHSTPTQSGIDLTMAMYVIDISTLAVLRWTVLRNAQGSASNGNKFCRIVNASSTTKVLTIGRKASSSTTAMSYVIFGEDYIVFYYSDSLGAPSTNTITNATYIKNDATAWNTQHYPTLLNKEKIVLTPFYSEYEPSKTFKGLYFAERLTISQKEAHNFSKDGRLYYSPECILSYAQSGFVIVISDEVQEVTQ